MKVTAGRLTVECPHCKGRTVVIDQKSITKVDCAACGKEIVLPNLVGTVSAQDVEVYGSIDVIKM